MEKSEGVIYKDLSYEVMAAAFEVQNTLGSGFLEKVYENALAVELSRRHIEVEVQKEIQITYKGIPVGVYFADIFVNNEIIIELKAAETMSRLHEAQLPNYLKATGARLGLLINFGKTRLEYKRLII